MPQATGSENEKPSTAREDRRIAQPFSGHIARTVQNSTPSWETPVHPGEGAPNVITIVLDDVGFAQLGCYGSSIATPHMDALAASGVRYGNFHVAALCSPTRASLMTGRNHHAVGMGFLADFDTGYPGYRGAVTVEAAMLPEILNEQGYGTYAVGKWHLTPPSQMTSAGPFDQWPTGRGFDRYYGFLWGEDDQWAPELWEDQHHVELPDRPDYHLSEDLVDRSRQFLADHLSSTPDRPFYLHLAFGACHAPHQAPADYIERYRGAFDQGWDVEREQVLARQIELGVVPPGTVLPAPNSGVPAWETLDADQRRLYARMQEVFAGFMEHTDAQIGRLMEFLTDYDVLDNTLIVLMSDNGASGEGGENGSANEYRYFLGVEDHFEDSLAMIDQLGSPLTHNHYPTGWAQAGNTPLKMYKKHTFGGGVRAPLIIHWPGRLRETDVVRQQFHHVIDLMPTILEATGTTAPDSYRGVAQIPVHGTSLAYTFTQPRTTSTRNCQYFETAGYRGLYKDGFKLVTDHQPGSDYESDRWELYSLEDDFSESNDLAQQRPELTKELVQLWWEEAGKYGVLPLDDRMQTRVESRNAKTERTSYRLLPGTRLPNGSAGPSFGGREFTMTVRLRALEGRESGVLTAYGRRAAGFVLFMENGKAVFDFNCAGNHSIVEADSVVPAGTNTIAVALTATGGVSQAIISYDGATVGAGELPSLMPAGLGCLSLQIGHNSPSPVSSRYEVPARFSGTIFDAVIEFPTEAPAMSSADWHAALARE